MLLFNLLQVLYQDTVLLLKKGDFVLKLISWLRLIPCNSLNNFLDILILLQHSFFELIILRNDLLAYANWIR